MAAELRQLYDRGTAFFTKESIRDLGSQLQVINARLKDEGHCDAKAEVLITDVNGTRVRKSIPMRPPPYSAPPFPAPAWAETSSSDPGQEKEEADVVEAGAAPRDSEVTIEHFIYYQSYQALLIHGGTRAVVPALDYRLRDRTTRELVPRYASLPLDDVRGRLAAEMRALGAEGGCWAQLRATLRAAAPRMPAVTKIVAFAMGTISLRDHPNRSYTRSLQQHALVLAIRSILDEEREEGRGGLACFAQDPEYSEVDKAVLREHGITVLEDPQGFLDVDEGSVVLSFSPNVPVKQIVADIARPAMIMWEPPHGAEEWKKHKCIRWINGIQEDRLPKTLEESEAST